MPTSFNTRALLTIGLAFATVAPASAALPIYNNPGVENPAVYGQPFAANSGLLRLWFAGNGGAAFTNHLGVKINGVDQGIAFNNQTNNFGDIFDFAINAGDIIDFYVNVINTGLSYDFMGVGNPDSVQHFYRSNYVTGAPVGFPATGAYFGFEDLPDGGDFNYTDMQWVARTGNAVPEPATWAFMIFGFGAIGGAMRRQRKANVKVSYA